MGGQTIVVVMCWFAFVMPDRCVCKVSVGLAMPDHGLCTVWVRFGASSHNCCKVLGSAGMSDRCVCVCMVLVCFEISVHCYL